MATEPKSDWGNQFHGRDPSLRYLIERWHEAKSGKPTFVALVGPTGIGKTRLAQEFYRWLTKYEDPRTDAAPQGYWPDAFHDDATSGRVNPVFDVRDPRPRPPIPFLWWGVKFDDPSTDRLVRERVPLSEYAPSLTIHTEAIEARLKLKEHHWNVGWKLASIIGNVIPLVGLPATARDVASLKRDHQEERELRERAQRSPGAAMFQIDQDLSTLVLDYLRMTLNPGDESAPTVPVVLFIDDAQWADPYTLAFLQQLWESARTGWPLMIVATHWDDEWEHHRAEPFVAGNSPERLVHLLKVLRLPDEPGVVHRIEKLPDEALKPVVAAALPGLLPEQLLVLLDKTDGNPRLLEQYVKLLLVTPKWFDEGDVLKPLKPNGVEQLKKFSTKLHDVIKLRFKRMEDHVQAVLGWSSAQGDKFLADITRAVGRQMSAKWSDDELDLGLRRGETPHRMVQLWTVADDPGRFNRGAFRQAAFHHVAREVLAEDPDELAAVERAVRETLTAWIADGSVDHLPDEERRDVLLMAWEKLRPAYDASESAWSIWGTAVCKLVQLQAGQYLWPQALEPARDFVEVRPSGWPITSVKLWLQLAVVDLLVAWRDFDRAKPIVVSLVSQMQPLSGDDADSAALHDQTACLQRLGDIETSQGHREAALSAFIQLLETSQRLLTKFGRSPESLRDVGVSLNKVGDAMRGLGRATVEIDGTEREALDLYLDSLALCREIVTEFGRSPESLRDVSVSLDRVGDALRGLGRATVEIDGTEREALDLYLDSLALRREIVTEFGRSPQSLRDVSVSLHRVGDAMRGLGRATVEIDGTEREALDLYLDSLALRREIVTEFGRSPESLRDVSVSLNNVGDALRGLGRATVEIDGTEREALDLYLDSLALCREIVTEFGRSPESLRDVSVSLHRVGDALRGLGRATVEIDGTEREALDLYLDSLALCREIVTEFGRSPQSLRDVSVSLDNVGDALRGLGRATVEIDGTEREALDLYLDSLALRREIVTEFGRSPQSLRDVSVSLNNVGDALRGLGRATVEIDGTEREALDLYLDSLALRREIVTEFGRSPQSLRDVSVSLNKVGDAMRGLGRATVEIDGTEREALDLYLDSLALRREIVTEFGRSPESLRDVSVSLNNVGDALRGLGRATVEIDGTEREALDLYLDSLALCREIVTEFGRSPESLRDVSVSLHRVGDALRGLGRATVEIDGTEREALDLYLDSLALCREIVTEFGRSPESLRDWALSKIRVATCEVESDIESAIARFEHARELTEEIIANGWGLPQNHADLEWINDVLAQLKAAVSEMPSEDEGEEDVTGDPD